MGATTAAVIIIGDEILKGTFPDENGPYFIRRLRELGLKLGRIVVLPDEVELIAAEVSRCASMYDVVFTTGGVGPTHDDCTFEAIARAFDQPLWIHPELRAALERWVETPDAAMLRMATIPKGAVLEHVEGLPHPTVRVSNVWIFPGVPRILKMKFEALAPTLAGEAVTAVRVYARDHEMLVAKVLAEIDAAFPDVTVGSYPRFGETEFRLIVTLEAANHSTLEPVIAKLQQVLDVVRVD